MDGADWDDTGGARLAQALCARLCHELGGPVGSLMTALDVGTGGGAEAEEIARDALETLRRRVLLFRMLSGGSDDLSAEGLAEAVDGLLSHGRVRLDTGGMAPGGAVRSDAVPCVLAAILVASESLPRGGSIALGGDPARALALRLDGTGAGWTPVVAALLTRGAAWPGITPRTALAHLLVGAAGAAGFTLDLAGADGGAVLTIGLARA